MQGLEHPQCGAAGPGSHGHGGSMEKAGEMASEQAFPWDPAASPPPQPADFTNNVGMRITGSYRCCPASNISFSA